jgi:hypothetical protein
MRVTVNSSFHCKTLSLEGYSSHITVQFIFNRYNLPVRFYFLALLLGPGVQYFSQEVLVINGS